MSLKSLQSETQRKSSHVGLNVEEAAFRAGLHGAFGNPFQLLVRHRVDHSVDPAAFDVDAHHFRRILARAFVRLVHCPRAGEERRHRRRTPRDNAHRGVERETALAVRARDVWPRAGYLADRGEDSNLPAPTSPGGVGQAKQRRKFVRVETPEDLAAVLSAASRIVSSSETNVSSSPAPILRRISPNAWRSSKPHCHVSPPSF